MKMQTPEPCAGCRFARRCRAERLACAAATAWAAYVPESRWRMAPRAPTRALFEMLLEMEQRKVPLAATVGDIAG